MKECLVSNPYKADVLLLVDVHNLSFKSYYAPVKNEMLDKSGYPTYHYMVALSKIASVVEYISFIGKVCIVLSSDEYPTKKKKLFPEYKTGRNNVLKEYNVRTLDGVEQSVTINPVRDIKKLLNLIPHCTISIPSKDEETDDIIATATKLFKDKICYILSNDKDLWQLKSSRVRVIYKEYPAIALLTKEVLRTKFFGIDDPRLIPLVKTLTGDSSDRLKGVYRFPRKVIPSLTYDMFKGKPMRALTKLKGLVTKSVKYKIESDTKRLVQLYKIIKLNKNLKVSLSFHKGNLKKYLKFMHNRGLKDTRILELWIRDF